MRRIIMVVAVAALMAAMMASAFPVLAEPPLHASNMGVCSSFLGQQQVRDDVNHLVKAKGYENPGEIYKVRARQHENLPPEQECLPRK